MNEWIWNYCIARTSKLITKNTPGSFTVSIFTYSYTQLQCCAVVPQQSGHFLVPVASALWNYLNTLKENNRVVVWHLSSSLFPSSRFKVEPLEESSAASFCLRSNRLLYMFWYIQYDIISEALQFWWSCKVFKSGGGNRPEYAPSILDVPVEV